MTGGTVEPTKRNLGYDNLFPSTDWDPGLNKALSLFLNQSHRKEQELNHFYMQYLISISLYAYHLTIAERTGIFTNNGYKKRSPII
jgi:hypothetical protein